MGQSKISLKELASVRRKAPESIDEENYETYNNLFLSLFYRR
jgi:hypothetical protein